MLKPPEEFHFRGQQPGERVELMLRQHPMTLLEHALKVVALLLVVVFLWRFFGIAQWVLIVTPVILIIAAVIAFRSWYGWWNTMMVLTNERVLFVEQVGFANRKMSEALLENIQFVTNEIKGVIRTMGNFGSVRIQTAGSAEVLVLKDLADPYETQQAITRLQRSSHQK